MKLLRWLTSLSKLRDDRRDVGIPATSVFAKTSKRYSTRIDCGRVSTQSPRFTDLAAASASRPSGEWVADDYDVLAKGVLVGRIFKAAAPPVSTPWMWTLAFGHYEDRTPTRGVAR
jgi:hypothetical protein